MSSSSKANFPRLTVRELGAGEGTTECAEAVKDNTAGAGVNAGHRALEALTGPTLGVVDKGLLGKDDDTADGVAARTPAAALPLAPL